MICVIQRVTEASIEMDGAAPARIGPGLVALVAVERDDTEARGARLLERVLTYRVFADDAGRMDRSLKDTGGGLLLVPNFTLAADTAKGTRASFSPAAEPERARERFEALVTAARARHPDVAAGRFGAHMQVALVNDGPVTFRLTT